MDLAKIYKNFDTIEKYLEILDSFNINNEKEFDEKVNDYLAISMSLFTILNACIEIGEGIIDKKKLKFPTTYREIFEILQNNKIISKQLAINMTSFMRQRNMIAHQYDEIKTNEIFSLYKKRDIFNKFILETKKYF